jgi:hypothetical protein
VNDRKAFLQKVRYSGRANLISNPRPHSEFPFYRRWLGDTEIERIDAWNDGDAAQAALLFPELRELFFVDERYNINREYRGPQSAHDDWKPAVQMPSR